MHISGVDSVQSCPFKGTAVTRCCTPKGKKKKKSGSVNVSQGLLRLLVMHWLALGCSLWFIGEVIHICFKLSMYSNSP